MKPSFRAPFLVAALAIAFCTAAFAGPPITIRSEKGGKVVLVVDDETVRAEAGGKPVLTIDGPNISKDGKRLFFIDGDILHAYVPEGAVVGYIDGRQLRTKPGGAETVYIDGPNILLPDRKGKPIFWIDDHAVLNNQQLMAALFILKPEVFVMPKNGVPVADAPTAGTPSPASAGASGGAAPVASDAKEFAGGTYAVQGVHDTGTATIAKQGDVLVMSLKDKDGAEKQGVAVLQDGELWAAIGPPNTVGLVVYKVDAGKLLGTWYNATGDATKFGSDDLTGPARLGGKYTITSAKAPFTGTPYTGSLTLTPPGKKVLDKGTVYKFAWDLGTYKATGVGFVSGTNLIAALSTGSPFSAMRFKVKKDGSLEGEYVTSELGLGSYELKLAK